MPLPRLSLWRSTLLLLLWAQPDLAWPQLREFIFAPGSAPFASSHASTLVEMEHGTIMAAWFGGTAEGESDVAIWGAQRRDGHWTAPRVLVREEHIACWNPVLFHAGHRLWLYYKFGPSPSTWTAGRLSSDDEGATWSSPEHLLAGITGPIRAKPLLLQDGTIVSGSSVESYHSWAAWIERSTDHGETWTKFGPIVIPPAQQPPPPPTAAIDSRFPGGLIQPSVVQLREHHLRLYARSTESTDRIAAADSSDNGVTWTQAHPLDLPNPNSGIDAATLRDGRVVLIYNNTTTGRTPLNLAVSSDGEHFTPFATLEDQPGEYSYPALIQAADGDLCMTYTWNRKTIRFVRMPLAALSR